LLLSGNNLTRYRIPTILKWSVFGAIIIFIILFFFEHTSQVKEILLRVKIGWFFPLIVLILLSSLSKAASWARLLQAMGCDLSLTHLVAIWCYSLGGKYVPGSIWMMAGRVYQLKNAGVSMKIATYSAGIEQIVTLSAGILIVLVTPDIYQHLNLPPWIGLPFVPFTLIILFPNVLGDIVWKFGVRRIDFRLSSTPSFKIMLQYFLFNLFSYIIVGIAVLVMFRVFDVETSEISIINTPGINAAGFVVGYLSLLTPGGIGVREGVFAFLLSKYTYLTAAVLIAFSLRIWSVVADGIGILSAHLYFYLQHRKDLLEKYRRQP